MKQLAETNWHELPEPEVVRLLESDPTRGLAPAEVGVRLRQFGRNEMTAQKRMSEWKRFLLQFAQPLRCVLLSASGVTLFLGEHVISCVIFVAYCVVEFEKWLRRKGGGEESVTPHPKPAF